MKVREVESRRSNLFVVRPVPDKPGSVSLTPYDQTAGEVTEAEFEAPRSAIKSVTPHAGSCSCSGPSVAHVELQNSPELDLGTLVQQFTTAALRERLRRRKLPPSTFRTIEEILPQEEVERYFNCVANAKTIAQLKACR